MHLVSELSFENDFVNVLNTKKITDLSDVSIEEKKHSISRAPILVEGDVATDIEEVRSFKDNRIKLFSKRHFLFFQTHIEGNFIATYFLSFIYFQDCSYNENLFHKKFDILCIKFWYT